MEQMKQLFKKLWSYKFRVMAGVLLILGFEGGLADGFSSALVNTVLLYSLIALGQLIEKEIK